MDYEDCYEKKFLMLWTRIYYNRLDSIGTLPQLIRARALQDQKTIKMQELGKQAYNKLDEFDKELKAKMAK